MPGRAGRQADTPEQVYDAVARVEVGRSAAPAGLGERAPQTPDVPAVDRHHFLPAVLSEPIHALAARARREGEDGAGT
jgi:hypothetical protein